MKSLSPYLLNTYLQIVPISGGTLGLNGGLQEELSDKILDLAG